MVDALPTEPQYVYAAALVLPSGITVSVNTDGVPFLYPVCLLKVGLSRKEDARRLRKLIAEEDWVRASHYLNPRSDVRVSTKASRLYAVNNAIASITTGDRDVEHAVIEIGMFVPLLEGLNAPRKSRVENQLRKRFGRSLPCMPMPIILATLDSRSPHPRQRRGSTKSAGQATKRRQPNGC